MKGSKNICQVKGCINEGRYCRLHLNYSIPVVKEVNKVSDNQKETLKEYKKVRAAYLAKNTQCKAKLEGCKGKATEVHHMAGKSCRELYLETKLFLAICHHCHEIITKNSAFAIQSGLSVSRHSKKAS
jgi:hypothetical protein